MDLRLTANSFDLFDTLIARRTLRPQRIFEDVERALGAQGFTAARLGAEHLLMQAGRNFDLHDIYREMVARGQCSADVAARLMAAEIDAEFDHAVPVKENLAQVREFDLVVSDMYLPADVLRRLLQHVGLRVFVHIFVSNAGKRSGTIWPLLNERWLIQRHLGDNPQADVSSPGRHGIAAEHYLGTQPSSVEQFLEQNQLLELAGIVRALRLRNPYPAKTAEFELWTCYAQLNLPLLCLAVSAIREVQLDHGRDRVLFCARDCYFLSDVFSLLHPSVQTGYLGVSRHTLQNSRPAMKHQLDVAHASEALVVDLVSTGNSWYRFAEAESLDIDFFALIRIAKYASEQAGDQEISGSARLRFTSVLSDTRLSTYTNAIEVLNTAPYGSTQEVTPYQDFVVPTLAADHELPPAAVAAMVNAHDAGLDLLRRGRRRLSEELPVKTPAKVLETLVQTISVQLLLVQLGKLLGP